MIMLCLLLVLAASPAQEGRTQEVKELIQSLGAPDIRVREAAERKLRALGADSIPALRLAVDSLDGEIRARATSLLDELDSSRRRAVAFLAPGRLAERIIRHELRTGRQTRAYPEPEVARGLQLWNLEASPDGRRLAFYQRDVGLSVMSRDWRDIRILSDRAVASGSRIRWSPDGARLLFTTNVRPDETGTPHYSHDEHVLVVDVATGKVTELTAGSPTHRQPCWSPDGRMVAFVSNRAEPTGSELFVVAAAGGEPRRLTDERGFMEQPCWSPDGSRILLTGSIEGAARLFTVEVDTGRIRTMTEVGCEEGYGTWSPDGSKMAFLRKKSEDSDYWDLWVAAADGTEARQLTSGDAERVSPSGEGQGLARWAPDGTRVAIELDVPGRYEIWVVNVDGSGKERITSGEEGGQSPTWCLSP